jgi:hypothetical protein
MGHSVEACCPIITTVHVDAAVKIVAPAGAVINVAVIANNTTGAAIAIIGEGGVRIG